MSLLEETLEPSLVANPEARVRCQPVMTQQQRSAFQLVRRRWFKVRKHTTVLRITTQLYSHRKKITFHGGGEKFKRNHEDRGQKREI